MKKRIVMLSCTAVFVLCAIPSLAAMVAMLSASDFLPIVQAPPEQRAELLAVKDKEAVKVEQDPVLERPVVQVASTQDAINAIVAERKQGCQMIATADGGYGFVATGIGTYRKDMENVTAYRIVQRNAYVEAFMQAKSHMAGLVGEMAVDGVTTFDKKTETIDTEAKALRNQNKELTDSQKAVVAAVLKGYVTYEVHDDFDKGIVYVTIVSTPKSRGKYSRPVADALMAESLNEGLNMILAEIQNGLVPPVGGRIIEVPGTGEIAFVGFGSSVVRIDPDPSLQTDLLLTAEKAAELRASTALCGMIIGDKVESGSKLDEQTNQLVSDFAAIEKKDPITGLITKEDVAHAEGRRKEFRNKMEFSQTIKSASRGTLPPGVIKRTWLDAENAFAYGVAVYSPSISNAAAGAAKEMSDAQILKPVVPTQPAKPEGTSSSGGSTPMPKPSDTVKQGVSGTVSQDI